MTISQPPMQAADSRPVEPPCEATVVVVVYTGFTSALLLCHPVATLGTFVNEEVGKVSLLRLACQHHSLLQRGTSLPLRLSFLT
jgi:hypothetical protein